MSSNRTHELPDKQAISLAFLEETSVFLHLDPRRTGVSVPVSFTKQPQLVLQVGLNMPVPIRDLALDDAGVTCTLSFNRTPHYCVIPWTAIFAIVAENGRGMVWPDDVPPEVAAQLGPAGQKPAAAPPAGSRGSATLKAVPSQSEAAALKAKRAAAAKRKRANAKEAKALAPAIEKTAPKRAAKSEPQKQQALPVAAASKRPLPPYLRVIK